MRITVDRRTGEIISAPVLTQDQKDQVWAIIVRKWIEDHPDEFRKLVLDKIQEDV